MMWSIFMYCRMAEAQAHASLGYIYELLKDTDKAIDHYEQRLRIALDVVDKAAEARSYCSIGNCLKAIVQPEKALECYNRSLMLASEMEDRLGEGVVHANMGTTHEMLSNMEEALVHQEKQMHAMQQAGNLHGEALALESMAHTLEYMGSISQACETLKSLIAVQKKLRYEGELIDSLAKLSLLREQGGDKAAKSGAGSGGGLKNTLKKMKPAGKKKRQRNVTAPEISAEALKGLRKEQAVKPGKDGRGLFGKKPAKSEKEGGSPRKTDQDGVRETTIREEGNDQPVISSAGDGPPKSESRLSEYAPPTVGELPAAPLPHSKTDPSLSYQTHADLSQLSLSSSIPEEAASTQSSLEGVALEQLAPPSGGNTEYAGPGGGGSEDRVQGGKEEVEERDFRKGCPELYNDYGDEQHKLNLKHVLKFLESCNETSPVDLSSLVDWDGWTLVSKGVM
jgi:hypothetical protein